jgi:hypothetical protein
MVRSQLGYSGAREQRRYKRYIVTGTATLQTAAGESRASLLNFGRGGMLVRTDMLCPDGTELLLSYEVGGYPETCVARGKVVGSKPGLLAIMFFEEAAEVLLRWLEEANCTWSGVA